jgi:hypothetical protein
VETSDGAVQADSGPSVVEVDDGTAKTMEIARADGAADAHVVADTEFGQGGRRADSVQEMVAGVDGVGDSREVLVELAACDRVEQ